jgi:hypothetical protein
MLACCALVAIGCAPGLEARWQGTGERGEARFFQFAIDLESKVPTALWVGDRGSETRLAVCALAGADDGVVEFRLDPDTPALNCDDLKRPLTFKGAFGRDVLAGSVQDSGGGVVGRFRAFRSRD